MGDELRCQDCHRHHETAGDAHDCDEGIEKYGRLEWRRMTAAFAGLNRPKVTAPTRGDEN